MVSDTYSLEFLKQALEYYTPSRAEGVLANMIKDRCVTDLGFEQANIDSVGNVIAVKGSGSPTILLCGHMDTVPNKIPVRIENGFLYGRGASDAKAPLISMLMASSEFQKNSGTLVFAAVVDEEGNATGVKQLVKNRDLNLDYAIFGEPSGINNITISYKGRVAIRLTCDVLESSHASAPWLSKNSIEEMYDFWNAIKLEIQKIGTSEKKTDSITCSLTEINGGSSHNVTPQKCKITVDIRVPTNTNCQNVLDTVKKVIEQVSKNNGVKATFRVEDFTEPFEAEHSSPLVRALSLAIIEKFRKRPLLLRKTGTGDMNILGNTFQIPVVTYGPGDPHSSHTVDEHVNIQEYLDSVDIYVKAISHISRFHNKQKESKK